MKIYNIIASSFIIFAPQLVSANIPEPSWFQGARGTCTSKKPDAHTANCCIFSQDFKEKKPIATEPLNVVYPHELEIVKNLCRDKMNQTPGGKIFGIQLCSGSTGNGDCTKWDWWYGSK